MYHVLSKYIYMYIKKRKQNFSNEIFQFLSNLCIMQRHVLVIQCILPRLLYGFLIQLLWWFFLFYVLVFKIFLCCWRPMCVFIVLVKLR